MSDDLVEARLEQWPQSPDDADALDARYVAMVMQRALAEIRSLREQVARLQTVIDSRPAINAGLPETYIEWSRAIMLAEAAQVLGMTR